MKMKPVVGVHILGGILVIAGLAMLIIAAQVRDSNAAVQASPPLTPENSTRLTIESKHTIQGKPIGLMIPSLGIQNSVIDGLFDQKTQQWTLTLDRVQHARMTYQPNDSHGLTFMYGHNRKEVFSRLPRIQPGDKVIVTTDNNYAFTYRFKASQTTSPQDTSIFTYDGPPILVLQTCTGLFFQDRQLFIFEFVGVEHV